MPCRLERKQKQNQALFIREAKIIANKRIKVPTMQPKISNCKTQREEEGRKHTRSLRKASFFERRMSIDLQATNRHEHEVDNIGQAVDKLTLPSLTGKNDDEKKRQESSIHYNDCNLNAVTTSSNDLRQAGRVEARRKARMTAKQRIDSYLDKGISWYTTRVRETQGKGHTLKKDSVA